MPLDYYHLSEKPFELSPDPRFLFFTPGYEEALNTALEGIMDRRGLIVITGEAGTGKTLLVYSLMNRLPGSMKTAFLFHSTFNFTEILTQIFIDLGEPPAGENEDLKIKLTDFLIKLKGRGEGLVVFIDEAQKLSEDALRGLLQLLNLEPWIPEILQLVLVGQTEFENSLNTISTAFPRLHSPLRTRLPLLSAQESLEYIEHRLNIAGRSSADIFSPQALSAVTEYARGIPRLINVVCDNALFNGYTESSEKITMGTMGKVFRNLEGPGQEFKISGKEVQKDSARPPRSGKPSGLALGLSAGLCLTGAVLLLWHFEVLPYLKTEKKPGISKTVISLQEKTEQIIKTKPAPPTPIEAPPPEPPKAAPPVVQEKPAPPEAVRMPSIQRIKAQNGENLSRLILRYYGKINESLISLVTLYNPAIKKPDLILINQEITFPMVSEEALIMNGPARDYSVLLGVFPNSESIKTIKNQPILKNKEVSLQPNIVGGTQRGYRLVAGTYKTRSEALATLKDLRQKNLLPFF
jgi:general secretion pathway protein A